MKYKFIIPYIMSMSNLLLVSASSTSQNIPPETSLSCQEIKLENSPTFTMVPIVPNSFERAYKAELEYQINQMYLDDKADVLVSKYVDNMLDALKRLNPLLGTRKYYAAVRRELPNAPVGLHCVYGQYTQLSRAQKELGDTVTIIPSAGRQACLNFKYEMRRKYKSPEYAGAIAEGKMHPSDSAYNVALDKYMTRHHVNSNTPDSIRTKIAAKFAKSNFSVEQLTPGAMLVVPRYRGSKTKFHMIMFLGRGRIENGKFIADKNGKYIYTGHNRETIGYLIDQWDTSNVFAADTKKIVRAQYAREWSQIEALSREELIEFVQNNSTMINIDLSLTSREELLHIARTIYFNTPIPKKAPEHRIGDVLSLGYPANNQYYNWVAKRMMQHTA